MQRGGWRAFGNLEMIPSFPTPEAVGARQLGEAAEGSEARAGL